MEPQRKQQQNQLQHNSLQLEKMSASSYLCRQNATRWTPTTEQIKLLKELYYVNGVRSPTADQIQAICARLRRYGKIEGKNVFYWFQNHKARERQKKRLTPTNTATPCSNDGGINCWKQDETTKYPCNINNPGISCSSSSAGVVSGGFGYGAVTMENKFRDCSISEGVLNGTGNSVNINSTQWNSISAANFTSYGYSNFYGKISTFDKEEHEQDHYYVPVPEKETLPLFPMHNEDHNNDQLNRGCQFPATGYYTGGYQWSNGGNNGASLELSLNSHGYGCYSHHY